MQKLLIVSSTKTIICLFSVLVCFIVSVTNDIISSDKLDPQKKLQLSKRCIHKLRSLQFLYHIRVFGTAEKRQNLHLKLCILTLNIMQTVLNF